MSAANLIDGANGVSDWRMFAADGFVGRIDAGGTVIGSLAKQDITVIDAVGQVIFDSSFNRGGDVIRLPGYVGNWSIARNGSNAVLKDDDTTVIVPLGLAATSIVFADGVRSLRIDAATQTARLGEQTITSDAALLRVAPDGPVPGVSGDDSATARLFLSAGGDVVVSGDYTVIGTTAQEHVTVLDGSVTLDSSFNRGGDIVTLDAQASAFTAARSGSNAVLASETIELAAPAGTAGMTLAFHSGERELRIDTVAGAMMVGDQALTLAPLPLIA